MLSSTSHDIQKANSSLNKTFTPSTDCDKSTMINQCLMTPGKLEDGNFSQNQQQLKRKLSAVSSFVPDHDLCAMYSMHLYSGKSVDSQESFIPVLQEKVTKRQNLFKAVAAINAHVLLYTLSNSMFKSIKVSAGVTVPDFMICRYSTILLITLFNLRRQNVNPFQDHSLAGKQKWWLFFRIMLGLCAFTGFTISVVLLPLSILMVIVMTNPFWTMILSYLINGTKIWWFECMAMAACFVGVVSIVLSEPQTSETTNDDASTASLKNIGYLMAALTAMAFSSQYAISNKVMTLNPELILFYLGLGGVIISILGQFVLAILTHGESSFFKFSIGTYCYLIVNSLVDFGQVACSIRAFQLGDAGFISIFGTLGVAYAFVIDVFFWNESITTLQVVGASVIVLSTVGVALVKFYIEKSAQKVRDFQSHDSESQLC